MGEFPSVTASRTIVSITLRNGILILAIQALLGTAWAQGQGESPYLRGKARTYTELDGLPSSNVRAAVQGADGRMWFATRRGVAVYDGFTWEVHGEGEGLPSADVRWLKFDEEGALWALCRRYGLFLARWNGRRWVPGFSNPEGRVKMVSAVESSGFEVDSKTGQAFAGTTSGLFRFDGERWSWLDGERWVSTEDFEERFEIEREIGDEGKRTIEPVFGLALKERDLFMGNRSGLHRLPMDRPDGEFQEVLHERLEPVRGLQLEDGRLWIVGKDRVGWIENDTYDSFAESVDLSKLFAARYSIFIREDGDGGVLLASQNGAGRLSKDGTVVWCDSETEPYMRHVQDLHRDREGNMWVAWVRGVSKLVESPFKNLNKDNGLFADEVTAVLERRSGQVVLGHGRGLTFLDSQLQVVDTEHIGGDDLEGRVMSLVEDERGSLWVATSGLGLFEMDATNEIDETKEMDWRPLRTKKTANFHSLLVDGEALWIGSSHGLLRLPSPEDAEPEFEEVLLDGTGPTVRRLEFARDGSLLVGTTGNGVFRRGLDGDLEHWGAEEYSRNSVYSLHEREDGVLWVGTDGGLMTVVDGELRPPQDPDPVIDHVVYFIEPTSQGTYWFGTDAGAVHWSDGEQTWYGTARGLAGFETNRDAGCVDRHGRMWIGTNNGVSIHIPDHDQKTRSGPLVELVSIDDGEGAVPPGSAQTDITARGNSLIFRFRGISFVDEDQLRFRYRLVGSESDKEWAGPERLPTREKHYPRLPAGDYRFSIQAIDVDGNESVIRNSPLITIATPFFERPWVITAEVVLGLGILGFLLTRAVSMHRAKEAVRESRAKDEFIASVSHELRTPLNAIMGLSEALQEEVYGSLTAKQASSLNIIETSAKKLLGQINNVIDLSRIAARKIKLEHQELSVELSCKQAIHNVRPEADAKHQEISFEVEGPHSIVSADPARVRQILDNLLENAVKFSPEEAGIRVGVATFPEEAMVEISVLNERSFIPPEELKDLFTPFLQLDGGLSRMHGGTGLGLVLVQRLTEMHGGRVEVESTEEEGTRFTVALPMQLAVSSH